MNEQQRMVDNVLNLAKAELATQFQHANKSGAAFQKLKKNQEEYEVVRELIKAAPTLLDLCKHALSRLPFERVPSPRDVGGEQYWDYRNELEKTIKSLTQ